MKCQKYLDEINAVVNDFTQKFGCRASRSGDFVYLVNLDQLFYTLDFGQPCKENRQFMASVKRHAPKVKLNLFTWCLLHELGHHMTLPDFDDDEIARMDKKRFRILKTKATLPYFNLPDEWAATEWAVNYANTHAEEVKEFEQRVKNLAEQLLAFLRAGAPAEGVA